MTQQNPSVMLYSQALLVINQLTDAFQNGVIKSFDDLAIQLNQALGGYQNSVGGPLSKYEPLAETEPPVATKMNRFWQTLQDDISILQQQADVSRASAILLHTLVTTEIEQAANLNAEVANKLKTLQLYSDSFDPSILTFADAFNNSQFIDNSLVPADQQVGLVANNYITLGPAGPMINASSTATVQILDTSNGISGNNQEITDPKAAPVDPSTNMAVYSFVGEQNPAHDITMIIDNNPSTWFEYESYQVTDQDRATALNFNFDYQDVANTTGQATAHDWAKGPSGDTLHLNLEFDLGSVQTINDIAFTPYGLADNANFPVKVTQVQVSGDGTTWVLANPQNVFVATQPNIQGLRAADTIVIREAHWSFQSQSVQYIRVKFEQANWITCNIGHVYYVDNKSHRRVEGPAPPISNIAQQYDPALLTSADMIQQREFFVGKRWAVGIRDFIAQQVEYVIQSTMISTLIEAGGLVDRVTLDADIYIPPAWDTTQSFIAFYITPDNGLNWYQINRVRDDFLDIPEEIAFNDPLPQEFRETGVSYVTTPNPVKDLRVKIVLTRPTDVTSATPVVRSYKLKVKRR